MGRISNYQEDSVVGPKDKVVGSELIGYNSGGAPYYKTRNFTMFDIQTFVMGGNFTFQAPINITIGDDGIRNWSHDTISISTITGGAISLKQKDNNANGTPTTFTAITNLGFDSSKANHLNSYTLTTFTMPEEYSFIVTGDDAVDHSDTGTNADSVDQTINFEQTLTISSGDAWISTLSSNGNIVSIYHNYVTRTDVAYVGTEENFDGIVLENDGIFTVLNTVTSDNKGHVTGSTTTKYTLPDYKFNIAADSTAEGDPAFTTSIDIHSTSIDTLSVLASEPISSIITANDTITISHDTVSRSEETSTASSTPGFGGTFTALDSVSSNTQGHVIASDKTTVTIPNTVFVGSTAALPPSTPAEGGSVGLVPAPASTDILKFLRSDGNWNMPLSYTISTSNVAGDASSNPVVIAGATIGITDGTNTSSIKIQQGANVNIGSSAGIITISSTDTSYSIFTETVAGLVPAPTSSNTAKFLRGDGNWEVPTNTQYSDFTVSTASAVGTAGLVPAPGIGTQGGTYFLNGNGSFSIPPVPLASSAARGGIKIGYTEDGKNYPLELSSEKAYVNVPWTDTWNANAKTVAGYVAAPGNVADQVWKTNASGVPAWRTDANTTYSEATSTTAGLMSTTHHDKLGGIEDNATADQTAAQLRTAIGTGNGNLVPPEGTAGHFLKHDGTFGLPSYTTNTNTTYSNFTGATNNTFGLAGLVPAPGYGETALFLKSNGTWASTPDTNTNTTYSPGAGIDLSGTTFSLTQTTNTGNLYYKIPFMNNNVINIDSTISTLSYNPSTNVFAVGKISIGTTATIANRSIYSQSSGSNYFEIANTSTSNGGRLLFGCTSSGFNGIYSRNDDTTAGREFRLIQLSATVITVATDGDTTFVGDG